MKKREKVSREIRLSSYLYKAIKDNSPKDIRETYKKCISAECESAFTREIGHLQPLLVAIFLNKFKAVSELLELGAPADSWHVEHAQQFGIEEDIVNLLIEKSMRIPKSGEGK